MSKSLNNFITIKDLLKNNSARTLRLFSLKSHYRSPIDYSEKEIGAVKKQLERIDEFAGKLNSLRSNLGGGRFDLQKYERQFDSAMEDDFNAPKAVAVIFDLISKGNSLIDKGKISSLDAKNILEFLEKIDKFFGFIFYKKPEEKIPEEIKNLAKDREKYRQQKNWQKADEIRKKMEDLGYSIKDTPQGPEIKKL
jgi:cysteinyl-tRNA synthetase